MKDKRDGESASSLGRLGRPRLPVEEARTRGTVTFLTEQEYEQLTEIARRNKLSISSLVRKLLMKSINGWI